MQVDQRDRTGAPHTLRYGASGMQVRHCAGDSVDPVRAAGNEALRINESLGNGQGHGSCRS
jgi:hypothetical protein